MTATSEHLELAGEFPASSLAQWQGLVAATLAKSGRTAADGAAPEDALSHVNADGIRISPIYTAADAPYSLDQLGLPGFAPFVRGSTIDGAAQVGWDVRQKHSDPGVIRTRRAILDDLENGVTSLWIAVGAGGIALDQLPTILQDVLLDLAPIVLDAGEDSLAAAKTLLAIISERGTDPAAVRGNLGADPVGLAARNGTQVDFGVLPELLALLPQYPQLRAVTVDATVYHEAGGSDSDELAISASVGVAYLRELLAAGLSINAALAQLEFRYAVTADQFGSIAKLRAARRIWTRIAELSGAYRPSDALGASPNEFQGQRQHAVTSAAMMTRRDPWVNMLRTTIACFAAAVGGAESITVNPFDTALGLADDFSRRIARNTQAVLHDESSLARVADPAGGSWFVESLTEELAMHAWTKFTELEKAGGAVAALASGAVAELLSVSRAHKLDAISHRRDAITGVSEFPLLSEKPLVRQASSAVAPTGLPVFRYAEVFEQLRDRVDAHRAATGVSPLIFLAALGGVGSYTGRLDFARNLFEIAGIEALIGTGDAVSLGRAFADSECTVACLCASDKVYAAEAADVAAALKAAGASQIWIAGKPALAVGDINAALYAGCDAVDVLTSVLRVLEVA